MLMLMFGCRWRKSVKWDDDDGYIRAAIEMKAAVRATGATRFGYKKSGFCRLPYLLR